MTIKQGITWGTITRLDLLSRCFVITFQHLPYMKPGLFESFDGFNGVSMERLVIRVCGSVVTLGAAMPSTSLAQEHGIRNAIKCIYISMSALAQFFDDFH